MSNSGRGGGKEESWRWERLPEAEYRQLRAMFPGPPEADRKTTQEDSGATPEPESEERE